MTIEMPQPLDVTTPRGGHRGPVGHAPTDVYGISLRLDNIEAELDLINLKPMYDELRRIHKHLAEGNGAESPNVHEDISRRLDGLARKLDAIEKAGRSGAKNSVLTVEDVMERYGVKRSTVYDWVHAGKIPYLKLNGKKGVLRFRLGALLKWEENHEVHVAEDAA